MKPILSQVLASEIVTILSEPEPYSDPSTSNPITSTQLDIDWHGLTILIADDDIISLSMVQQIMEDKGCKVITANNGQEALALLNSNRVDGILMDCHMPVMDGYTATKQIKENQDLASIPIIALTANITSHDKDKIKESGMLDLVSKPIDVDKLLASISTWFGHNKSVFQPTNPSIQAYQGEFKRVLELFDDHDTQAIIELEIILESLEVASSEQELHQVLQAAKAYDFERATHLLSAYIESK